MPLSNGLGRRLEQVVKLGRGNPPSLGQVMQSRTLVEVEADTESGWVIALVGKLLEHHETKLGAIGAADSIAARRHANTGEPTGVSVQVGIGRVVIALRG